jgi:hypothetical protein
MMSTHPKNTKALSAFLLALNDKPVTAVVVITLAAFALMAFTIHKVTGKDTKETSEGPSLLSVQSPKGQERRGNHKAPHESR